MYIHIFTADIVQQRFASMRHTFMTNYRKEQESKRRCSGKGTEEIYKPKWVLYERLKFLKRTCAQANTLSNLQSLSNVSPSDEIEYSQDSLQDTFQNIEYLEDDPGIAGVNFDSQVSFIDKCY